MLVMAGCSGLDTSVFMNVSTCVHGVMCVSDDRSVIAPGSVRPPKASQTFTNEENIQNVCSFKSGLRARLSTVLCLLSWLRTNPA